MKRLYHINFPKSTQISKRNNQKYIDFIKKICYNSQEINSERNFLWQITRKMLTTSLKRMT